VFVNICFNLKQTVHIGAGKKQQQRNGCSTTINSNTLKLTQKKGNKENCQMTTNSTKNKVKSKETSVKNSSKTTETKTQACNFSCKY